MRQVETYVHDSHNDSTSRIGLRQILAFIDGKGIEMDSHLVVGETVVLAGLHAKHTVIERHKP